MSDASSCYADASLPWDDDWRTNHVRRNREKTLDLLSKRLRLASAAPEENQNVALSSPQPNHDGEPNGANEEDEEEDKETEDGFSTPLCSPTVPLSRLSPVCRHNQQP